MLSRFSFSPLPLLALFTIAISLAVAVRADPAVRSSDLLKHVKKLSSDKWEGRATGSEGEKKATDYIVAHFKKLGFQPAGDDGGWFQAVSMPAGYDVDKKTALEVPAIVGGKKKPITFALGKEFYPLSISGSGRVEGEVVFAGYGVHAPDLGYDDYAGLDANGKVVVVFRHAPTKRGDQKFNRAMRGHASFVSKLKQATDAGAIALIVVNNPRNFPTPKGPKARRRPDTVQKRSVGGAVGRIPCLHMTMKASEEFFVIQFGEDAATIEERLVVKGQPTPASMQGRASVRMQVEITHKELHGRNVCALLPAGGRAAVDEVVVLGAHHDHLGYGQWGSLERSPKKRKEIHNGADDNASGTSGLLEAAEYLASRRKELRRSILFITFTGEERGLVGSAYWCDHPTVPLAKITAMLNMDMIGRLDGRKLFIGGTKTSPAFEPILRELTKEVGIDTTFGAGGMAPSDNTSFYRKKLPVLFFFTGLHPEYHRPSDDWNTLDIKGMEKVARLAALTTERVANLKQRPKFTRADKGGSGPPRPILGISVGRADGGVAVAGLAKGGPAEKAGLKTGDVIVELDGKPTSGPGALQRVMQRLQIGQKVSVRYLRGGKAHTVKLVLGQA